MKMSKKHQLYNMTSDIFAVSLEINKKVCSRKDYEEFEHTMILKNCECLIKRNSVNFKIYKHSRFFEECMQLSHNFCVSKDLDVERSQKK